MPPRGHSVLRYFGASRPSGFFPSTSRANPPRGKKEAQMQSSDPPLRGDELLSAVTESMVALHERYYRLPATAKTQMLGTDLLACVLGGVFTDVEKTMIEIERTTVV